jgi:hypothetical protein
MEKKSILRQELQRNIPQSPVRQFIVDSTESALLGFKHAVRIKEKVLCGGHDFSSVRDLVLATKPFTDIVEI